MVTEATAQQDHAADAAMIAVLYAVDPVGLGGVVLRGYAGPAREGWLAALRATLAEGAPLKRLPHGIADDRLLGGLDLTASLSRGAPVLQKGVLAEADGGTLVITMAERLSAGTAAKIVAAIDLGAVTLAREGFSAEHPARFGAIVLDEGLDDDETPPAALLDRLAFRIELGRIGRETVSVPHAPEAIMAARGRLADVETPSDLIGALCEAAYAFGIDSMRAVRFALNAARASAALGERRIVGSEDAALAARLVLSPRATRVPAVEPENRDAEDETSSDQNPPDQDPPDGQAEREQNDADDRPDADEMGLDQPLADIVRQAVRAALPSALLASLAVGAMPSKGGGGQGRSESSRKSAQRGRPIGSMRGELRSGARLALLDTLRAAAPWQRLRRSMLEGPQRVQPSILVRSDDFRIMRFKQRIRTTTIFVVDASGSAALHRLAEAKGAVELLLADCYVRRDEVALIAFRGKGAEILLPPTRSLARAKRSLAQLPGGGGTPLAAGVRAAHELALATAKRGDKPVLVFLTDGQANIAFDGVGNRPRAQEDATLAARALRMSRLPALLIDTSARPQAKAQKLAAEMGARYLPMPSADLTQLPRIVQSG